jgi:hypothetical protein
VWTGRILTMTIPLVKAWITCACSFADNFNSVPVFPALAGRVHRCSAFIPLMGHTAIRLPGNKIAVCYQYPLLRGLQRHLRLW